MIYLGIFYKDNGKVTIQEFDRMKDVKEYIRKESYKYWTYDIYTAKCINNKVLTLWK